jgi:glycosyltransferase involved in cell wall biosynthesis
MPPEVISTKRPAADSGVVSVAVPCLDHGCYLRECLASIQAQDHANFEVLIADGGSTDGSLDIIEEFTFADARFRLVSRTDRGQADAVQRAFSLATGDIFCFLNADDCYIRTDTLSLAAAALADHPHAGVVSFAGVYLDGTGRPLRPVRLRDHPLDGTHLMRFRTAVLQPGTFWRREVQQQIPLMTDLHYVFDAWFFYDAYCRFGWVDRPEAVAGYRLHGENKSAGVRPDRIRELAAFERHKFGPRSWRGRYLDAIAGIIAAAEGSFGDSIARRVTYLAANSLSYVSAYRVPGI